MSAEYRAAGEMTSTGIRSEHAIPAGSAERDKGVQVTHLNSAAQRRTTIKLD
ncbi:MAG: hypothetical protein HOW73_27140 [Polyangiaceae bacterium]|nr:hypothetical protein [Polyangiaceae bacterium]